ncbi:hypothetical protein EK904_002568 [Melospiza melodia maxima]|nr:hypothetical protein EK904_002568 [Melospiza melodia maxima]
MFSLFGWSIYKIIVTLSVSYFSAEPWPENAALYQQLKEDQILLSDNASSLAVQEVMGVGGCVSFSKENLGMRDRRRNRSWYLGLLSYYCNSFSPCY